MQVKLHTDFASLSPWSTTWNELAGGVPFRRWEWLETWWRHYGCDAKGQPRRQYQLFVLTTWSDDGQLTGIAPWYRLQTRSGAQSIHFLGDGEVCSDYVSVLCRPGLEDAVTAALADWLSSHEHDESGRWDRLEFYGMDAADPAVVLLLANLQERGNKVHHCAALDTWRLELPASWEEFLKILSKPHRNRVRQLHRKYFESGRATVHHSRNADEIEKAFQTLIQLHQNRWERRGLPGCFASSAFETFHREASLRLLNEGAAALNWLELDGRPLAAEYQLMGGGIVYAYQSGMDTSRLSDRPGHLANMASLRRAIEQGQHAYDFLRGDEPYKAHWRAQRRPMLWVRVVPDRAAARLRHNAWLAGQSLKQWIKYGMALTGVRKQKQPTAVQD
jgi:CelD/BcsL family acetyltransferase involved in cellulose biosynthesis